MMRYTRYPEDIDETYVPQVGDKIERTDKVSGTVTVGSISMFRDNTKIALDSNGTVLWQRSHSDFNTSYRLLFRYKPKAKVGDHVIPLSADNWMPGTLIANDRSNTIRVVESTMSGVRFYRDVRINTRTHSTLNTLHTVLYLPQEY